MYISASVRYSPWKSVIFSHPPDLKAVQQPEYIMLFLMPLQSRAVIADVKRR